MNPTTYLQKQYNLLLSQSNNNTIFQVKYKTTNILVSNISESDILTLKILVSRHGMLINVISVNVTTSNSTINNPLLAENMSEAISLLSTKKSYGEPFTSAVFGSANLTINGVADTTSELLNEPTQNMVKTYTILFVPLNFNKITSSTAQNFNYYPSSTATTCSRNFITGLTKTYSSYSDGTYYNWVGPHFFFICTAAYQNNGVSCVCTT
jgi:hypothetical protein